MEVLSEWRSSLSVMARFVADQSRAEGSVHVLLITTGSVASIKAPLIVQELLSVGFLHR